MNAKGLFLLAALTALAAYAAVQLRSGDAEAVGNAGGDALLPALDDRLNDVAEVRIEGNDQSVTLRREGERWVVVEQAGYPADFKKLSDLMAELKQARRVERKTRTEQGFATLGVQEPGAEDSTSRKITLLDASGAELGGLVVGKRRFGKGTAQGPVRADQESYVRVAGDEHAWLAAGNLSFDTTALRWLDAQIANVPRDRVQAARFTALGAEPLTLVKRSDEAFEMEPLEVPEGREPKKPLGTGTVLNALAGLRFDDVQRAADFDWPLVGETSEMEAVLWTDDGLRVTVTTLERDEKVWAQLRADVVDTAEVPAFPEAEVAGPPAPEDTGAAEGDATAEGEGGVEEDGAEDGPSAEDLAAEAAALNEAFEGWVFSIPSWKANAFRMSLEDVLAPLPEPEEAELEDDASAVDGGEADPPAPDEPPVEDPSVVDPPTEDPPASDPPSSPPAGGGDL